MVKKQEVYKWIKIGGLLSFLPFVLVAGPLLGWWVGDYVVKAWNAPFGVLALGAFLGFLASIMESARLIRLTLRLEKNSK